MVDKSASNVIHQPKEMSNKFKPSPLASEPPPAPAPQISEQKTNDILQLQQQTTTTTNPGKTTNNNEKQLSSVNGNSLERFNYQEDQVGIQNAMRSWHSANQQNFIKHQNYMQMQNYVDTNSDGVADQENKAAADDDDHVFDFELIDKVRQLLKQTIESKQQPPTQTTTPSTTTTTTTTKPQENAHDSPVSGQSEAAASFKYSRWHYDELMDPQNPYTCWRYLLHTHKNLDDCVCLMLATLEWRYHNQIDPCMNNSQMIKEFWHMTPVVRCGRDKAGNSVYCIIGRHYRKPDPALKDIIRAFIVNLLFEWDRIYTKSFQKLTIIFDVSNTGYQNIDLDFMSWMVSIRDFLPARMANIYVIGIPFLIRPIVRLIISWLPENFRNILQCGTWQELILQNIDDSELPQELGGSRPDERLAPPDAPWWSESASLNNKDKIDAIEWCIGFSVDKETREKRRQMQIDFEAGLPATMTSAPLDRK